MSKFLTETQDPGVRGGTPVNAVQAEKTIDPAGTNNKIKWKARAYGRRGNRVSVEYRHGGANEALEVETIGNKIVVHLETNPYENVVTTAADVLAEVGAYHLLVTVEAAEAYSDGLVAGVAETHLAGGLPSGPLSVAGTILEDAYFRYFAREDALERDDADFESHWDRTAL